MPSDPSGAQPKGVLVRPASDFFDDHLYTGGYAIQIGAPAGNNFIIVSLFNNANSGILFKVYAISVASDGGTGSAAWTSYGVPAGTLVGPCLPIRADQGAPYGLIYQQTINQPSPTPNPVAYPPSSPIFGTGGFDSMTYPSLFPWFILPVGYALNVVNVGAGGDLGAAFWYQQANE